MGGFFGVTSKEDCVMDLFLEQIIIPIWEPVGEAWRFMAKAVFREVSTTLKTLRSAPNLSGT